MDLREFGEFAQKLARKSGEVIGPYFGRPDLRVEEKGDASPVTAADREAEAVMRDAIQRRYPDHGVIGEEFGRQNDAAEFVWVLDPIDGTVSFARGCPLFGTLIGLLHGGRPVLGLIHQPLLGQLCLGMEGRTTLNQRRVQIQDTRSLVDATLLTTDLANVGQHRSKKGFDRLLGRIRLFRTWGDCYGYLLLVGGGADIMLDPVMNPWDLLPLIPIIGGAGGMISDWSGGDAATGTSAVAAGRRLHAQVIEILNA